jgi:DNA-binding NarL/FixJ family response regulator
MVLTTAGAVLDGALLNAFSLTLDAILAPGAGLLRRTDGLTPAEIRLAQALLSGEAVAQIAEPLGAAASTAKTHLTNLFETSHTNRQAELVRLLMALAGRVK